MIEAILLVVLAFLMSAARSFLVGGVPPSAGTALAFGYLMLTAHFGGGLFKQLGLPRLTGYLVAGLFVGPAVLDLVDSGMLDQLSIVTGTAAALIALTAGLETEIEEVRPLGRTLGWLMVAGVGGTTLALTIATVASRPWLPFMAPLDLVQSSAVALVIALVLAAQSPAVAIALHRELDADGPVSRMVLATVVANQLAIILGFALATTVVKATLGMDVDVMSAVMRLAWEIPGSVFVGLAIGAVLAVYAQRVVGGTELFTLTTAFVVAEVGDRLEFDPLLIALTAGLLVRNASSAAPVLLESVTATAQPVYVLFFAVAGATIHLDALAVVGVPAVVLVTVRAVAYLGTSNLVARWTGADPQVQKWLGFGLLPQAGLAIALALLFGRLFPEFGAAAGALTLAVVSINELVAPALYRYALLRAGEAGKRGEGPSAGGH